jgi:hypothetical protein
MAPLLRSNARSIVNASIAIVEDDDSMSVTSSLSLSNTSHHARLLSPILANSNHSASSSGPHSRHQRRRQRPGRSVVFNPTVTVHDGPMMLSTGDYTPRECRDCWYTEEEVGRIRSDNEAVVEWMDDHGENVGCDFPHTRGLEARWKAGRRQRRARRTGAMAAVMSQQRLQLIDQWVKSAWGEGDESECDHDDDGFAGDAFLPPSVAVAISYAEETFPDVMDAYERAVQDAKEAQQVHGVSSFSNTDEERPTLFDFRQHEKASSRGAARGKAAANPSDVEDDDNTIGTMVTVPAAYRKKDADQDSMASSRGKKLRERFAVFMPLSNRVEK